MCSREFLGSAIEKKKLGLNEKTMTLTAGYAKTKDCETELEAFMKWACTFVSKAMFQNLDKKNRANATKFVMMCMQLICLLQSNRDIQGVVSSWHAKRCDHSGLRMWKKITKQVPCLAPTFFDPTPEKHEGVKVDKSCNKSPVYHPSDTSFLQMTGEVLHIWCFDEDYRKGVREKSQKFKFVLNTGTERFLQMNAEFMRSFANTHELQSAKALWVVPWLTNLHECLRVPSLPSLNENEYPRGMLFVVLPTGEMGEPGPGQQMELSILAKLKADYPKLFYELSVNIFPCDKDNFNRWYVYGTEPKTTTTTTQEEWDGDKFTLVTHFHGGQPEKELLKGANMNVIADGKFIDDLFATYAVNADTKGFAKSLFSEGNAGWARLLKLGDQDPDNREPLKPLGCA